METNLEQLILRHLVQNEEYTRKVIPFLKKSYFYDEEKIVFEIICDYVTKYNVMPEHAALVVEAQNSSRINENNYESTLKIIHFIFEDGPLKDLKWIYEKTEEWCKEKALHNAVMESIDVIQGKHKTLTKGSLPKILQDALSVSFDRSIGHDYFEDHESRFEFYQRKEIKIPFDLECFNTITKGGFSKKTLNVIMAATGVGKSLMMCHMAASNLSQGYNVLYITLEMAEERIAERIDANLLDYEIGNIATMQSDDFHSKLNKIKSKSNGKLIIKEYPTAAANVNHFRALLDELKLKKNFTPDIVYVDYLNIAASSRLKSVGGAISTYVLVKSIAEELRGLAVEENIPIVSATQTNRDGYNNSDVDLTNTSESFGLPQTVDFMIAVMQTQEMRELQHFKCKQLKNRYEDLGKKESFTVGVDKAKMKLFDMEDMDSGPIMDTTDFNPENYEFGGFKF